MSTIHTSTFEAAMTLVREHVARHPITPAQLPDFITLVHAAILKVASTSIAMSGAVDEAPSPAFNPSAVAPVPAVPIRTSVTRDYIICLEDGSRHKMMKRYLMRVFGVTPQQYRAKWGLPDDYPMTAPGYSEIKRREAASVGLGSDENKRGVNLGHKAMAA